MYGAFFLSIDHNIINQELCDIAFDNYNKIFNFIQEEFVTYDMCVKMLKKNGNTIATIPDKFFNEDMIKIALEEDVDAIRFIPEHMKTQTILDFYETLNRNEQFNRRKLDLSEYGFYCVNVDTGKNDVNELKKKI